MSEMRGGQSHIYFTTRQKRDSVFVSHVYKTRQKWADFSIIYIRNGICVE